MLARTPARMLVAPSMTAFMPDAHTLLTVVHTVDTGSPASKAACRAGAYAEQCCALLMIITSRMQRLSGCSTAGCVQVYA